MIKKKNLIILSSLSIFGFSTTAFLTKINYFKALDLMINTEVHQIFRPKLTILMKVFTEIGDKYILSFLFLFLIILLYSKNKKNDILIILFSSILGFLSTISIKSIIERNRPENAQVFESTFSFPSAHATMSTIFFLFLAYYISNKFPKIKFLIWTICFLFFLIISFSRIYLNVHYLSDVIAGIFLATFYFSTGILIFSKNLFQKQAYKQEER
jgi:undecaprenyl-diphosphatase